MLGTSRVACKTIAEVRSACNMLKEAGYTPLSSLYDSDRVIYINIKGYKPGNYVTIGSKIDSDRDYEPIPYGDLESRLHPKEQFNDADFLSMLGGE